MTENLNAVKTRQGYDAFAKGDLDGIREFFAPDVVWHELGQGPLSGEYHGVDEVVGLLTREYELCNGDISIDLVDLYATDTRTVAIQHIVAHRNGKTLDQTAPIVYDGTDGVAREVFVYPFGREDENAAFWA